MRLQVEAGVFLLDVADIDIDMAVGADIEIAFGGGADDVRIGRRIRARRRGLVDDRVWRFRNDLLPKINLALRARHNS